MTLIIETNRDGYSINQVRKTMTVAALRNFLDDYDDDTPIYLSFDNGYTYGGITEEQISEQEAE